MTVLPVLPILVPMGTAIAAWCFRHHPARAGGAALAGSLIHLVCAGLLLSVVLTRGVSVVWIGSWPAPAGICLVADLLSAVLVGVTSILQVTVLVHTRMDTSPEQIRAGFHAFMQMLTGAVCGAFLTGDLFNLYVWFEVMLMASFGIMVMDNPATRLPNEIGGLVWLAQDNVATSVYKAEIAPFWIRETSSSCNCRAISD